MIHSILDAVMAVLWIGSIAACYVVAWLMRPRSGADGDCEGRTDGKADPGKEGGADDQRV